MKKVLFIYNPYAGQIQIKNQLWSLLNEFSAADYNLTVRATTDSNDCANYIEKYGSKFDLIIVSGGDGTMNNAVNGLFKLDKSIPIGYIPAGTTNDYAASLKLPKKMPQAAKLIIENQPVDYDIGKFNDMYFVYIAAFGLFTEVPYTTDQQAKNLLGHFAYVLEGVKSLSSIKTYHVEIKSQQWQGSGEYIYGMITNSLSVGGLYDMSKEDVRLDDGLFEVMLIEKPNSLNDLASIASYLLGIEKSNEFVHSFKTDEIELISEEEMSWTLDGENGGNCQNAKISVINKALKIVNR